MSDRSRSIEMSAANAALEAEEQLIQALEARGSTARRAREIRGLPSRIDRRNALKDALADLEIDDEIRQLRDDVEQRCWELALTGLQTAKFECRRRRTSGPVDERDLIQEATIGLYDAACRFEPARNNAFSTYARWWVRAHLTEAMQHGRRAVRVPDNATRDLRRLKEAQDAVEQRGEPATLARAAREAGMEPSRAAALTGLDRAESLDVQPEQSDTTRKDALPSREPGPLDRVVRRRRTRRARRALSGLPDRQAAIIRQRFGLGSADPSSFREIGEHLDISGERVRQLTKRALETMRITLRS